MNQSNQQQRGKNEPIRHRDKTAQDKTPAHLRARVAEAQARRAAARGTRVHSDALGPLPDAVVDRLLDGAPPIKETR